MYLLDTNILIEVLLKQSNSEQVKQFLNITLYDTLYLSEFSLYSLGVRLVQKKYPEAFERVVNDLIITGGIRVLKLDVGDMEGVLKAVKQLGLDFDDAYQYVTAEKYDLTLVSFDAHFDKTARGRKTPADLLSSP